MGPKVLIISLLIVLGTVTKAKLDKDWPFDTSKPETFEFGQYHTYDEMIQFMKALSTRFPAKAEQITIGSSSEGRSIVGLKVGTIRSTAKPTLYIDGGIHARDWLTSGVILYIMGELVIRSQSNSELQSLVDNFDFYLIPTVNPDGYEFSRSSVPKSRTWRKNRSAQKCSFYECCHGVDLNRNFNVSWGEFGTSSDPCDDNYAGSAPFSEPETRAVRDIITQVQGRLKAMISLHSPGQTWLIPYGNSFPSKYPPDYDDLKQAAIEATAAIKEVHGRIYIPQNGAISYRIAGAADDWTKQTFPNVKFVYTIEVRPEEDSLADFDNRPGEIVPTGEEVFAGIKVIAKKIPAM